MNTRLFTCTYDFTYSGRENCSMKPGDGDVASGVVESEGYKTLATELVSSS